MTTKTTTIALLGFFSLLLFSCGKSEAERMAIKWCECNQTMSDLYKLLDATKEPEKLTSLVSNIMVESNNVTDCMGGEEKLKEINAKLSASDKGDFQKQYDETRNSMCGDLVKLLAKKKVEHKPEPEPQIDSTAVDSTKVNTDSIKVEKDTAEDDIDEE